MSSKLPPTFLTFIPSHWTVFGNSPWFTNDIHHKRLSQILRQLNSARLLSDMLDARMSKGCKLPTFDTLVGMINECNSIAKLEQQTSPFTPNVVCKNHWKCPHFCNSRNNVSESMASVLLLEGIRHSAPPRSIWKSLQHHNNQMKKTVD